MRSPVVVVFLLLICFLLLRVVFDRYHIAKEMADRRAQDEKELTELEDRKEALEKRVEYLSHDRGIEAEMRRNFDVAEPGEKVVIILDDETSNIQPLATTSDQIEAPWYQFWR